MSVIRSTSARNSDGYTYLRRFLADIKTVASSPGQTQKSFFARSMSSIPVHLVSIANANRP